MIEHDFTPGKGISFSTATSTGSSENSYGNGMTNIRNQKIFTSNKTPEFIKQGRYPSNTDELNEVTDNGKFPI